jgi:hypothetical protein
VQRERERERERDEAEADNHWQAVGGGPPVAPGRLRGPG